MKVMKVVEILHLVASDVVWLRIFLYFELLSAVKNPNFDVFLECRLEILRRNIQEQSQRGSHEYILWRLRSLSRRSSCPLLEANDEFFPRIDSWYFEKISQLPQLSQLSQKVQKL